MSERHRPRGRDELTPAQRELYDRIVGGPRRAEAAVVPVVDAEGRLLGPFGPMTIAPVVGDAVQNVGAALRFATTMQARTKEAAILLIASHRRCAYEWVLHEHAAQAAGITPAALQRLRTAGRSDEPPTGLGDETDAALAVVARLLEAETLTDGEYAAAIASLGEVVLAELVWLVGYYSMLAMALGVFQPPLGESMTDPWEADPE